MLLFLLCLAPSQVNAQTPVGIAVGGDNLTRLLWNNYDGSISLWKIAADGSVSTQNSYGPYTGWSGKSLAAGTDNVSRILWTNTNGTAALWRINSDGSSPNTNFGPYSGWTATNVTVGGDNISRLLWNNTSGQMGLWSVAANGMFTHTEYGPFTGYTAFRVAAGPNSVPRTLWNKSDGGISLWNGVYGDANYSYPEYGPFAGYSPVALAVDSTNAPRVLWTHPSDGTISLWKVAADNTFAYQNFSDPAGYSPVGLAAGTGGDVRLLWSNGQGGALVWTIQQSGAYAQTYPAIAPPPVYPQVVRVSISPSTITANDPSSGTGGNTATLTVYLDTSSKSVTTVDLSNNITNSTTFAPNNTWLDLPQFAYVPAGASSVTIPFTAAASLFKYSSVTISAQADQNTVPPVTAPVIVFTPSGTGNGPGVGGGGPGTGGDQSHGMTITLPGTTAGSNDSQHILVGQSCAGVLNTNGIPASWVSNLRWSVSGQTIQANSWSVGADQTSSYFSGTNKSYTFAQATPSSPVPTWYWDDSAGLKIVTCSATVTPPAGQGSSYGVVVTRNVTLDVPKYQPGASVGVVQLNKLHYSRMGANFLAAGGGNEDPQRGPVAPLAEQADGINFNDYVDDSVNATGFYYSNGILGTWYRIQLISTSRYETKIGSTKSISAPGNAQKYALDYAPGNPISYVYNQMPGRALRANGRTGEQQTGNNDNDNPSLPVLDAFGEYNVNHEFFDDYIMYTPPSPPTGKDAAGKDIIGNSIAVPLFHFIWSWNVDVTIPNKSVPPTWSDWNDKPTLGVITPPSTNDRVFNYPVWTSLRNIDLPPS